MDRVVALIPYSRTCQIPCGNLHKAFLSSLASVTCSVQLLLLLLLLLAAIPTHLVAPPPPLLPRDKASI